MIERRQMTLDQLGRIVTGKTPSSSIPGYFGGHVPFVTPSDFDGRRIITTTDRYLTEEGVNSVGRSCIPAGAVMVSCIGSDMGKAAIAGRDCVTNQQINSIVVDADYDPLFVYYDLSIRKAEIQASAGGSAQPILNKSAFGKLEIRLPPKAEQRAIAGVLGALDDKIEQNRRTARTLERLARAIFRALFADFEPVKAKAAGATAFPSMPQPVFNALPTRFVDSAIGPVPEGWEVKGFGEVLVLAYGKALKADDRQPGSIPVYGSNGQVGWHNEAIAAGPGIVVGRKGNPGTVEWSHGPFFPIDTTFFVKLTDTRTSLPLLFNQLQAADLGRLATDSAVPGVNRNMIYAERCVVPRETVRAAFDSLALELWELQATLMRESAKLAELRDYLLPKLLSGAVRVKDAE